MKHASPDAKRVLRRPGRLWVEWEKTIAQNRRRLVLIEADRDAKWTAEALRESVFCFLKMQPEFEAGTKVAFCLPNGVRWLVLFLALQKLGVTAIPLDAGLPEQACIDMARGLGCRALYLKNKFQVFEKSDSGKSRDCCIKLTSGTSGGIPNHVPCRAEHLIADGRNIIRTMGIRANDRNLATIPFGHSYGLGNFILPLILQGTPLVCADHFVPHQLMEWIRRYRVTVLPSVPAIFRVLASMPAKSRLTPLRLAISAGAPLTKEVASAFFNDITLRFIIFTALPRQEESVMTGRVQLLSLEDRSASLSMVLPWQ